MNQEIMGGSDTSVAVMNCFPGAVESAIGEGVYHIVCRDADGNVKWESDAPNLIVSVGKQLAFDTLLRGSAYTVTGPFLGLISGTPTPAYADTMVTHAGWTEFTNYTVGGSAVRGTAAFAAATSATSVTTSSATAITYTITGAGGSVGGCFLVLGTGAVNTQGSTAGTLYSAGAFTTGTKTVSATDTITVTYSTTLTS